MYISTQFALEELVSSLPVASLRLIRLQEEKDFVDTLLQVLSRPDGSGRLRTASISLLPVVLRKLKPAAFTPDRRAKAVKALIEKLRVRRSDAAMTEAICTVFEDIVREDECCRVRRVSVVRLMPPVWRPYKQRSSLNKPYIVTRRHA